MYPRGKELWISRPHLAALRHDRAPLRMGDRCIWNSLRRPATPVVVDSTNFFRSERMVPGLLHSVTVRSLAGEGAEDVSERTYACPWELELDGGTVTVREVDV